MNAVAKPTLLLIDGHSLAFRAFYALSPDSFKTSAGQHTNAVHGFISMMLNILQAEQPTHMAVAFDLSRSSFRTDEYPAYKGTRGETPPEFNGQTELLTEALAAMNIVTITKVNYEADDVIATLSKMGDDAGYEVFIVSGDRDTFQLISENTTILYPVKGVMNLARMDDEAVYAKYGVHANQYSDLAALVGETSDNLPGIPGVGPKTAAKWLQEHHSLEAILEAADSIGGKVGESLREHKQEAVRNRRLNRLVRDLELPVTLDGLRIEGVNQEEVKRVFTNLQFRTLTERVLRLRGVKAAESADDNIDATSDDVSPAPEPTMFDVPSQPDSKTLSWGDFRVFVESNACALSFELSETRILALGAATASERVYSPLTASEAVEAQMWLSRLQTAIIFGAKDIERALLQQGTSLSAVIDDPLLEAYLIDPVRRSYAIDDLAIEHLGLVVKRADANQLIPDDSVDCSLDAWLAILLSQKLGAAIEQQDMSSVYEAIERPSSRVIATMEATGVQVNKQLLTGLLEKLAIEIREAELACFALIGKEINLASPKQLQTVLFEDLGMVGNKKIKTGFSTNAEALNTLFEETEHPFLEALLKHREVTKIRQMVEVLNKSIASDGRIHTNYVQTGTSTGRLSSETPNLQNIPIKTERGREIRDAFEVSQGFETLLTADYSQIEMRIMAHLSEDDGLIEAFNTGEDLHRFVGARIFGVNPSDVTPAMRSKVKAMSYGLVYGLSEYGLAKQLRISNGEAKELMADYFARFGGVRRYLASVVDHAKLNGYTVTTFGRRRPFDDLKSPIFQLRENARRAALNAPIQGTAADIMKLAMIRVQAAITDAGLASRMLLQVHDELVFEVAPGELEQLKAIAIDCMSNVVKLSVPLEVHVGIGKTWDAAGH
jgi:DNA polymerase-1